MSSPEALQGLFSYSLRQILMRSKGFLSKSALDRESGCRRSLIGLLGGSGTHFSSFPFLINDSGDSLENYGCFSSWNPLCESAQPLSLLDAPNETCLYFDFTSYMWFAEMGCWGFPPVHDTKFLFSPLDGQFYIWSKSCFLPGFLGKQFVKAAAFCPSASPVWIF